MLNHNRRWPGNSCIQAIRTRPSLALSLVLLVCISGCGKDGTTVDTMPPVLSTETATATPASTAFDLTGRSVDPFVAADAKAIVLVFIGADCPISNRYAPEIRRVEEKFARAGVKFWLVYADAEMSPDAIRKHAKDYQLPQQVLRDPHHALVRLAQARVTPEAAVFLPGARLVYHGRLDNRYADFGKERPEATQHDLEDVLEAILQGKPVPYFTAKAVGCHIPNTK